MADRLSPLLKRFDLNAHVFFSGALCGASEFSAAEGVGHLHLLRAGHLELLASGGQQVMLTGPVAVLFPRPMNHRLTRPFDDGSELVCATIDFGHLIGNPLLTALPDRLVLQLEDLPELHGLIELLFAEALSDLCGRQSVLDRLTEVLLIHMFRSVMDRGLIETGLFVGLADQRLAKALTAVHEDPAYPWTLEALAQTTGMSRARFSAHFTATVGIPAGEYLARWRLAVAQSLLKKDLPVNLVADRSGYSSAPSFSRAFSQRVGLSPSEWKKRTTDPNA
ncbi:AraC family transcriptional regulator [Marinobacter mobilis]|uniref:AraC family transcriptional regulator n=1 Tax=Marinobacter mobilis TaxID=488533 RepID=UPI0035C6F68A